MFNSIYANSGQNQQDWLARACTIGGLGILSGAHCRAPSECILLDLYPLLYVFLAVSAVLVDVFDGWESQRVFAIGVD